MPDKWPLANGNWSNAANWNDGTKPVAGDDVYADNRTVTVDEDFSVATIRNTARSGGTAGGSFSFSGTRNCTCNIITGNSACVGSLTGNITINGDVTGGSSAPAPAISFTNVGAALTVNGNLVGGTSFISGTSNCSAIDIALSSSGPSSTVTINGNITGGSGSGGYGIWMRSTAGATPFLTVTGNITSGLGAAGIRMERGGLTVNGNVYGNHTTSGIFNYNSAFAYININGNVYGGSVANSIGVSISLSASGSITINGNTYAGLGSGAYALSLSSVSICPTSLIEAIASTGSIAVLNSSPSSIVQIKRTISSSNGLLAVSGYFRFTNDADISMYHWRGDTTFVTLTDVTQVAGLLPTVGNVRQGTTYNAGGLTGTLAVPSPSQVAVGVATDNTVGTAAITEATIRSALGLASANLDTQLANRPTLAQIEASSVLAKEATVNTRASQTSVDGKPTLAQIEGSSVLAKSVQITSLQNNAPSEAF